MMRPIVVRLARLARFQALLVVRKIVLSALLQHLRSILLVDPLILALLISVILKTPADREVEAIGRVPSSGWSY